MILTREAIEASVFSLTAWFIHQIQVNPRRRFENTIELKEAIPLEWEALPQAVINNAIDGFRSRVRLVIAENGQHIAKH